MNLVHTPTHLRYSLSDAMLDYADQATDEQVAKMYRQDAQALMNAPIVAGAVVVDELVRHTAQTALVAKLAEAEEAAEQARRDLRNAEEQTRRYAAMLDEIR